MTLIITEKDCDVFNIGERVRIDRYAFGYIRSPLLTNAHTPYYLVEILSGSPLINIDEKRIIYWSKFREART